MAWPVVKVDISPDDCWLPFHKAAPPLDLVGVKFHNKKVVHRGADMCPGYRANWTCHVMRGYGDVVEVRVVGDFLCLRKTSHFRNVWRYDAGGLFLDQFAISVLAIEVLTRADRRTRAVCHVTLRLDVFRWNRIFQPQQIERLQCLRQFYGVVHAELPVGIHRHHNFRTDPLAHGAHHIDHPSHFLRSNGPVEWLEPLPARARIVGDIDRVGVARVQVELDGREPVSYHLAGALRIIRRIGGMAGMAIGIDADLVAEATAKERGDWRLQSP